MPPFFFLFRENSLYFFLKRERIAQHLFFSLFFFILSSVTISFYLCTVILHALVCIQISHHFLDLFFLVFFLERTLKNFVFFMENLLGLNMRINCFGDKVSSLHCKIVLLDEQQLVHEVLVSFTLLYFFL